MLDPDLRRAVHPVDPAEDPGAGAAGRGMGRGHGPSAADAAERPAHGAAAGSPASRQSHDPKRDQRTGNAGDRGLQCGVQGG